jgi:nicotinate-nucleotide--dimethylbenzimidazole phosphoribosyltransferase
MPKLSLPPIPALDSASMAAARSRLNALTKPPGSLGRLEDLGVWLAGVQATPLPAVKHRTIVVAAADHGVAARGVSAYPPEVTAQMVANFLAGGAAINVLARRARAEVVVVDAGVRGATDRDPRLIDVRIAPGTRDMTQGPSMTPDQARRCIEAGLALAETVDAEVVGCGEMGIGNTTAASAIVATMLERPVAAVTGRGTGLDRDGLERKVGVIEQALRLNQPHRKEPLDVLAKVGGFEIGLLAGLMLGASARRRAVLVDGFISGAAALLAVGLDPACRDYLLASHVSTEPGHRLTLEHLGLEPLLDLRLRLGEGTGAALAVPLLDAACAIIAGMATFDEAGVSGKREPAAE